MLLPLKYKRTSDQTSEGSSSSVIKVPKIPYAEVKRWTKNFSPELVIGEAGFGKVYLGTLPGGMKAAVKRQPPRVGRNFLAELAFSQIQHPHLVSLIGYCEVRSEMILVREFMAKGTLRNCLYGSDEGFDRHSRRPKLSWQQRLQICVDSAEALHYLHSGCPRKIIHGNVKSSKILLDENYVAKICDFSLSTVDPSDEDSEPDQDREPKDKTEEACKLQCSCRFQFSCFNRKDVTTVSTNSHVKGSLGYIDPRYYYLMTSNLSNLRGGWGYIDPEYGTSWLTGKSDVYSFGVVLLEVLCARPAVIKSDRPGEIRKLADWGGHWIKKGRIDKIIDPVLMDKSNSISVRMFCETVVKCLRPLTEERPVIREVLWDLEYALELEQNGHDPF